MSPQVPSDRTSNRPASRAGAGPVLVSDFDGTMTAHDFYKLAIERLIPADTPDFWVEYRAGRITHFEALRRYFAAIRGTEQDVLDVVEEMELDPQLPAALDRLHSAGWTVIVTSAGCDWYIRRLLDEAGVSLTVFANPGRFEAGRGLVMELPVDSPYLSHNLGVDKTAVVRAHLALGATVAFAGDGFPDVDPARLVDADLRFARGDLADVLEHEGLGFHSFRTWSEIPDRLLARRT
jgi:2-hydroxy-3-keto-5-methylthiopentenyl-1-phosphate phosphatase